MKWNPRDSLSFTFSSDDRTATRTLGPNNAHYGLRGVVGKASGKWYWEGLCIGSGSSQLAMWGVATIAVTLDGFWVDANGYGYYGGTGGKFNNGGSTAYGSAFGNGDVISTALDMDAKKVWFAKNGVYPLSGDPAAGTGAAFTGLASGTFFPIASCYYLSLGWQLKGGAADLSYTPPAGFATPQNAGTVVVTVYGAGGSPVAATSFQWAFFEQSTPGAFSAPIATGTASTDGAGVLTLTIPRTAMSNGDVGSLLLTTTDGGASSQCLSHYAPAAIIV